MYRIIIDCDGKQFSLPVSYDNKQTNVGRGYIMEQATFIDMPEGVGMDDGCVDFKPVIDAMRDANSVTIRFKGDKGTKDVTVTKGSMSQIATLWDISEILKEDPSLISVLA